jgi:SP family facilitated glucose transporter-like MFS transporter 3
MASAINNHHPMPYVSNNEGQHLLTHSFQPKPASEILDDSPAHLTPLHLGSFELYELIPFTALFGMQLKSKNVLKAFVGYASEVQKREMTHSAGGTDTGSDMQCLLAELETVIITKPLIVAILVMGLSQFLVGYNMVAMNSLYSVMFANPTKLQWSLAVGAFALGGSIGAFVGTRNLKYYGRRASLVFDSSIFFLGGLIHWFAPNIMVIAMGRLVIGYASGLSTILVPIYLGELAPPTLRGTLGTVMQFFFVMGILVSNLMAFLFASGDSWRIVFDVVVAISIIQLSCSLSLNESPRWLLNKDPNSAQARTVIKRLRGLRYGHEIETEIDCIIYASNVQSSNHTELSNMMLDKKIRKMLFCVFFLQIVQQLSGINVVFYYSSMIFEGLIDNPLLGTAFIGSANVAATYAALLLLECTNRRTLLLCSTVGMLLSLVALVMSLLGYFYKILSLCFLVCYVSSCAIGLGKIMSVSNLTI